MGLGVSVAVGGTCVAVGGSAVDVEVGGGGVWARIAGEGAGAWVAGILVGRTLAVAVDLTTAVMVAVAGTKATATGAAS